MRKENNELKVISIYLGAIILMSLVVPFTYMFKQISIEMFGFYFMEHVVFYHLLNLLFTYLLSGLFVFLLFKHLDVINRLHESYASSSYFLTGSVIVILFLIIRVIYSSKGGDTEFLITEYGFYPLLFAKFCLYIAVIRLLIGMEPKVTNN